MFPVRYELNSYINLLSNLVLGRQTYTSKYSLAAQLYKDCSFPIDNSQEECHIDYNKIKLRNYQQLLRGKVIKGADGKCYSIKINITD
jgi:hypothetical protein